jgi:hypothetical protein
VTDDRLIHETTVPESPTSINLTEVVSMQFTGQDGEPVGEALSGFMEITVHDQLGPVVNIYTSRSEP